MWNDFRVWWTWLNPPPPITCRAGAEARLTVGFSIGLVGRKAQLEEPGRAVPRWEDGG